MVSFWPAGGQAVGHEGGPAGDLSADATPAGPGRRLHDERHVDLLVVERRAVPPAAVLLELLAVVGGEHDERAVVEATRPQVVEEDAELLVEVGDLAVVKLAVEPRDRRGRIGVRDPRIALAV